MFAKSPAIRKRGDGAGDDAVVVAIHIPIGYGSRAIISEVEGWWCVRVTWQATNTYVMTPLFTGGFIDASGINFCKDINGNALYDPGNFNNLPNVIDDVYITIPMGGMDFFFFGIKDSNCCFLLLE